MAWHMVSSYRRRSRRLCHRNYLHHCHTFRLRRLADCGIYTAEQLLHATSTAASKGFKLSYEAYHDGKAPVKTNISRAR